MGYCTAQNVMWWWNLTQLHKTIDKDTRMRYIWITSSNQWQAFVNADTLDVIFLYYPNKNMRSIIKNNFIKYPVNLGICNKCYPDIKIYDFNGDQLLAKIGLHNKIAPKGKLIFADDMVLCETCGDVVANFE